MTYPALEPYGWGDRWAALFTTAVDPTPAPDVPPTPGPSAAGPGEPPLATEPRTTEPGEPSADAAASPRADATAGAGATGPAEPEPDATGDSAAALEAGAAHERGVSAGEPDAATVAAATGPGDPGAATEARATGPGGPGAETAGDASGSRKAGAGAGSTGIPADPPGGGQGSVPGTVVVPVPGRIVRHDGVAVSVALPGGVASRPLRRGLDPPPVVGDWVIEHAGSLRAVLPRSSLLERKSARREQPQPLAANVDLVLVVCGLDRPVRTGRIQRTATLAWEAGAVPSVVLTKADRLPAEDVEAVTDEVTAENPGLDVLVTSTRTGQGVDALRALVARRTVALIGESGAGKSSLVNLLLDEAAAEVGDVRAGDAKGRHTTTSRELHVVPSGGVVIDTPGIRSVGLWADTDAVATTFDDIDDLAAGCRFADCQHASEPGCAVLAAVEAGTLAADRLERWRALEREAVAAERRADPHAQSVWGRSFARIAKDAQRRKGRS